MEPKVSVIIPVYNCEKYLNETLRRLTGQSLQEIEILCVNDGSTDGSLGILNDWARKDDRIVVVDQPNSGAGAARNHGLRRARGEYLSILDSDDLYEPDMLAHAYECASKHAADMVVYGADFYYEDKNAFDSVPWLDLKRLPEQNPFSVHDVAGNPFRSTNGWTWDKLFKRSFIQENGIVFQEQRTYNDMVFTFLSFCCASRIATLHEVLIHQRKNHKTSLSQTGDKSWWCVRDALAGLKSGLESKGVFDALRRHFDNYVLHMVRFNATSINRTQAFLQLYPVMKDEWVREFGLDAKPLDYFDIPDDACWLDRVRSEDLCEFLLAECVDGETRIANMRKEIINLRKTASSSEKKLKKIQGSRDYKLGKSILRIPRKVVHAFRGNS
ncbi:glycosyltransferase family 2 protein [Xiamenia xianingshaonis]|nr:glycosyltransferase family 2 protein [Xiamenia xianingshaonis]QTU83701.1 glycosyltransferase family 2 protein [Xiamenia xianingshaonis]